MKYIKYIFYGAIAILAVFLVGKKDAGTIVTGDDVTNFFGAEKAYADTYQIAYGGDDDGAGF